MTSIAVVHLIRAANGPEPLARFLESYRAHPAGADHRLVCVFKGFAAPAEAKSQLDLLAGCEYVPLWLDDRGFDLTAYFAAAHQTDFEYYVFLNSFSQIRSTHWLSSLHRHAAQPGVGVTGCTASFETPLAFLRPRHETRSTAGTLRFWARRWRSRRRAGRLARQFTDFPNPHLRTNAFCIRREDWLALRVGDLDSKLDCWSLESGRHSLTRQMLARGRVPLVVGRNGHAYAIEDWPASNTFRRGEQGNLLIADNRTCEYANADRSTREKLESLAWGTGDTRKLAS